VVFLYCPKCATQNDDGARFCRACGTAIEVVALALDGKLVPQDKQISETLDQLTTERLEIRRAKGMRSLVTGGVLMAVSLAILFIPMLFSATHAFPWVVIWSAFFGWLAVWGTISVVLGIGRVMDSNDSNRIALDRLPIVATQRGKTSELTGELTGDANARKGLGAGSQSYDEFAPPSITETTTRKLDSH
jgi:hypothetical protein